jgi:hypothetical protein
MAATGTLAATLGGLSLSASAVVGLDRREEILVRLLAISLGITGVTRAVRNRTNISPGLGATIVIWNGDEEVVLQKPGRGPKIVEMTPVLRVMVEAGADDVGTLLNRLRRRMLRAILDDEELRALTGTNGEIRYDGLANSLERGLMVEGEDWLTFVFRYPLLFNEL